MADTYAAIRQSSLCSQIVETIADRIVRGELAPGDQLPPERELADQFAVSRTAVREAVKSLAEKGLIEIRRGLGTYVTAGPSQAAVGSLRLMLQMGTINGTPDLMQVREALEPEIAALAAEHATPDDIALVRTAINVMHANLDNIEAATAAELDFHLALARATHNPLFAIILNPILDLLLEQRKMMYTKAGGPGRGQRHHQVFLDALINGDPAAARAIMEAHLAIAREDLGSGPRQHL